MIAKPVTITNADRVKYVSPIVDGDDKVTKKVVKIINGYLYGTEFDVIGRDAEYNEKKLISKLIKLCGVEAARYALFMDLRKIDCIRSRVADQRREERIGTEEGGGQLRVAEVRTRWSLHRSVLTSIEDQLKEEHYVGVAESILPRKPRTTTRPLRLGSVLSRRRS